jgi:hypothetical protein
MSRMRRKSVLIIAVVQQGNLRVVWKSKHLAQQAST